MSLCQSKDKSRGPQILMPLFLPSSSPQAPGTRAQRGTWMHGVQHLVTSPWVSPGLGMAWSSQSTAEVHAPEEKQERPDASTEIFPLVCSLLPAVLGGLRGEGGMDGTDRWMGQADRNDGWMDGTKEWMNGMDGWSGEGSLHRAADIRQSKTPKQEHSVGSTQKPKAGARLLQSGTFNGDVELNGENQQKGALPAPRRRSGWGWTAGEGRARRCRWGTRDGGTRAGGRCRPTAAGHGHGTGLLMMQHPNCTPQG